MNNEIFYAKCLFDNKSTEELRSFVYKVLPGHFLDEEIYATVAYSRSKVNWPVGWNEISLLDNIYCVLSNMINASRIDYIGGGNQLCFILDSPILNQFHYMFRSLGASHDFNVYIPHITIRSDDASKHYNYSNSFLSTPNSVLTPTKIIIERFQEKIDERT